MEKKMYMVIPGFVVDEDNEIWEGIENDLVNMNDDEDRWMCYPDDFKAGQVVMEDEFTVQMCEVILDDGTKFDAPFAFRIPLVDLN